MEEIVRYGRFAVLDIGEPRSHTEAKADRPRYCVVEHDKLGPLLRAGPFRMMATAIEQAQAMRFRHELVVGDE